MTDMSGSLNARLERLEQAMSEIRGYHANTDAMLTKVVVSLDRLIVVDTQHQHTRSMVDGAYDSIRLLSGQLATLQQGAARWDATSLAVKWAVGLVVAAAFAFVWNNATESEKPSTRPQVQQSGGNHANTK